MLFRQVVIPNRADGEGPHACSPACLRKDHVAFFCDDVGRKLIYTIIARSLAVCAALDDAYWSAHLIRARNP
jgi:hypothetical protein